MPQRFSIPGVEATVHGVADGIGDRDVRGLYRSWFLFAQAHGPLVPWLEQHEVEVAAASGDSTGERVTCWGIEVEGAAQYIVNFAVDANGGKLWFFANDDAALGFLRGKPTDDEPLVDFAATDGQDGEAVFGRPLPRVRLVNGNEKPSPTWQALQAVTIALRGLALLFSDDFFNGIPDIPQCRFSYAAGELRYTCEAFLIVRSEIDAFLASESG